MKKFILIVLIIAVTLPIVAQTEASTETKVSTEKNVLKVNTLSLGLGTGSVFYERNLRPGMSGQLGLGYLNYGRAGDRFSGLFITPEVRFYPNKNALDGFFVAPYLRYNNLSLKVEDGGKGSISSMGGGLAIGRQWITKSGFTMDLFFGGHYMNARVKAEDGRGESIYNAGVFDGIGMRMGFAIGFAF